MGLQGRDLPQEVLHRDLPLLRGSRLHSPAGWANPTRGCWTSIGGFASARARRIRHQLLRTGDSLRLRPGELTAEGRAYYVGPRRTRDPARATPDLAAGE